MHARRRGTWPPSRFWCLWLLSASAVWSCHRCPHAALTCVPASTPSLLPTPPLPDARRSRSWMQTTAPRPSTATSSRWRTSHSRSQSRGEQRRGPSGQGQEARRLGGCAAGRAGSGCSSLHAQQIAFAHLPLTRPVVHPASSQRHQKHPAVQWAPRHLGCSLQQRAGHRVSATAQHAVQSSSGARALPQGRRKEKEPVPTAAVAALCAAATSAHPPPLPLSASSTTLPTTSTPASR